MSLLITILTGLNYLNISQVCAEIVWHINILKQGVLLNFKFLWKQENLEMRLKMRLTGRSAWFFEVLPGLSSLEYW